MADHIIHAKFRKNGVDIKDVAFTGSYNDLINKPVTGVSGVKGNAETTYRTGNVNLTPANIGLGNVNNTSDADKPISTATQTALNNKVSKTGDTMSGPLTHNGAGTILKNTNLDVNGDNPTSNTWSDSSIQYHDKDNARMGYVNVQRRTDGSTVLEIGAQARNAADTADIYNTIDMLVGRDGARSYAVTDSAAFRKAIGTGNQVTLTGAVTGTGTFDSNGNVANVSTTLNSELSGQINYNTNNGVKNLFSTEWFATKPNSSQVGTVESYDVETGSVTGFASASQTGAYLSINVNSNWCNQFLEDGKTYILSWTVDSRTNDGIFGFRRADNNAYSVGGSAAINRTGTYTTTYTHNASIPVFFSFCINTAATSSDKRIAISNLMLREATIEDDAFVPYAKSNAELTSGKLDVTGMAYYKSYPEQFSARAQKGSTYYELRLDTDVAGNAGLSHSSGGSIYLNGGTPVLRNSGEDRLLFTPEGCISGQPANSGSRIGLRNYGSGTYIGFFMGVPGVYDSDDIPMCTFTTSGIRMDNALISGRSGAPTLTTNTGTVYEFKDDGIYLNGTRIAP